MIVPVVVMIIVVVIIVIPVVTVRRRQIRIDWGFGFRVRHDDGNGKQQHTTTQLLDRGGEYASEENAISWTFWWGTDWSGDYSPFGMEHGFHVMAKCWINGDHEALMRTLSSFILLTDCCMILNKNELHSSSKMSLKSNSLILTLNSLNHYQYPSLVLANFQFFSV